MTLRHLVNVDEVIVHPFTSTESVEELLLEKYYVVVMDNGIFKGIVTQPDIIKMGHNLVIDCITPKSILSEDDTPDAAMQKMQKEKQFTLPVFDKSDSYIGSLSYGRIIQTINSLTDEPLRKRFSDYEPIEFKINNIVGDGDMEAAKQKFLSELSHHTKNPIQVIYSSLHLFNETEGHKEREQLLSSIYNSTRKIDGIFNMLYEQYLPK